MKRVIVIGCPGSGKSCFATALHEMSGIPLYHLDMMYWNADKTTVERAVFLQRLSDVLKKDEWIIDGNYASTMELRIEACDTVFFLDYPVELCLDGVRARLGKPRRDIPWIETEQDAEFIEFIKRYGEEQRPRVLELLQRYNDKSKYVFSGREAADSFLKGLK